MPPSHATSTAASTTSTTLSSSAAVLIRPSLRSPLLLISPPQAPRAAFSPGVSPSAQTCASSSSRLVKGAFVLVLSDPSPMSPSGKALFESRTPAGFAELFRGPHDYSFYTAPQQHAANKKKFWPRGTSSPPSPLFSTHPCAARLLGGCMYPLLSPQPLITCSKVPA